MRDLIAGDCEGYLTLFLETGGGLHNAGHIQRDSSGAIVDIRVSANSFPFINDWDEDGKKDIIMGETQPVPPATGTIRIYINDGTNFNPAFRNHTLVYAGGEQLYVDHSDPVVYDLDGDSIKDLIVGNVNGYLYFFENIGTNSLPLFAAEYETLRTTDGFFIDSYDHSRSNLVDWTGDGDLDIVMGGGPGYVWVCENTYSTEIAENGSSQRAQILQVTPNPCRGNLTVKFQIPSTRLQNSPSPFPSPLEGEDEGGGDYALKIYDAAGRLVRQWNNQTMRQSDHVVWSGADGMGRRVPAGVYFMILTLEDQQLIRKVILLQ